MTNHFEVNMDEYLPLRDVVFKTLRQAILKGELEPGGKHTRRCWIRRFRLVFQLFLT